jgi:regulator of sirC expression with transglutaminase-like and TPR domain
MADNSISEINNLMELIDEQDERLFSIISESILSHGAQAVPFLEAIIDKSLDDNVHYRVRKLIRKIRIQNLYIDLHNWATLESHDLIKGFLLISKYQFPDLDVELVMSRVEILKKQVWLELNKQMTPFEELKVMSKVFFKIDQFKFVLGTGRFCDTLCLNYILNNGEGFKGALSVLYTGIAQRLGIPLYGVLMPNTFYVAYVYSDSREEIDYVNDVKFYVNPFRVGTFISNDQVCKDLEEDYPEEYLQLLGAVSNQEYILQMLNFMNDHYELENKLDKSEELLLLMKALEIE